MKHLIILIALTLAACGGGTETQEPQAASCAGQTPIVSIGTDFAGACVVRVDVAGLDVSAAVERTSTAVDEARAATSKQRVYIVAVGTGAEAALNFMGTRPGYVDIASLWLPTYDPATSRLGGLIHSLVSVYLNAGNDSANCEAAATRILANGVFATCKHWPGLAAFGAAQQAQALEQMNLH